MTSISADTHKYGYGLKGTSTVLFRDRALRNRCYFFMPDWSGGKYFSPGMEGRARTGCSPPRGLRWCRSAARATATTRRGIFETSAAMQAAVRSHPELRLLGEPTFLFAFTSDEFDIYHVNDEMKRRGWRFNGLQYPNALHMAVTRPADAARRHASGSPPTSPPRSRTRASTRISPPSRRRSTAACPAA